MKFIKQHGVWIALALTLAVTIWVFINEEEPGAEAIIGREVVLPSHHSTKPSMTGVSELASVNQTTSTQAVLMRRPTSIEEPQNLFPQLVAVANAAETNTVASVAQPPSNPFIYAGKLVENGNVIVFLIEGYKSHAVKSGDVIEDLWQVTAITPPMMKLKYIPSKVEIQLQIGASS